eukprot:4140714-Amphidinium_carterae.1
MTNLAQFDLCRFDVLPIFFSCAAGEICGRKAGAAESHAMLLAHGHLSGAWNHSTLENVAVYDCDDENCTNQYDESDGCSSNISIGLGS